jgi:two-component system response regulator AtoC
MESTVGLGTSAAMRDVEHDVAIAARSQGSVLISGERGCGKARVARLIHETSARSGGTLVPVLCGRVPDAVLAPALFGQAPGPFARESERRRGALEQAEGGTVFLREIGATSSSVQVRLRQFTETGEIRPVGSFRPLPPVVNVRIIASTRDRLFDRIADGTFDEALYYRLNVVHIRIPPLRERPDDIVTLLEECLKQ